MRVILYLHGFLSSKDAKKPKLTKDFLKKNFPNVKYDCINLPADPVKGYACAEEWVQKYLLKGDKVSLIGSSLGGFYAMCLASKYQLRAALINPCVNPWKFLSQCYGEQENPYTGEKVVIGPEHAQGTLDIFNSVKINEDFLGLFIQKGDEVLDYRDAMELLPYPQVQYVENKGNHSFTSYKICLPEIVKFLVSFAG
ncbi:MAG: YqiA/YcfP family alpha/beta fold hydrolase [Succinivibrionaceae bacterium]|nr:hypothetical protein [Ruminobacter sp.]MDY5778409.1 YqiA/YcfP family alpha/beta fold hydrolase [Succinivibrionaceae bacterium]MEE1341070.1 YqiA/YcfP family alpha/beta fold hydrolase [Succinivibrionaceae bacterium]